MAIQAVAISRKDSNNYSSRMDVAKFASCHGYDYKELASYIALVRKAAVSN